MTTKDLKVGDKVRYTNTESAFMDMLVTAVDAEGVWVHRPYIWQAPDCEPTVGCEKQYFLFWSNMEWVKLP